MPTSRTNQPGRKSANELNVSLTRTAKNSAEAKALLNQTASDAREQAFLWPAPPYLEIEPEDIRLGAEECLMVFTDGTKATGRLVSFLADEQLLKFQLSEASASVSVTFSSLERLDLLRPVRLRQQVLSLGVTEEEIIAPSELQQFFVELAHGGTFRGETMGFVNAICGLFLFVPEGEGSVIRSFVPASAMRGHTFGPPIGQMLIDRNLASSVEVNAALKRQQELRVQKIGEYLTENQIVSEDQLAAALRRQRSRPALKLGESLIDLGFLSQQEQEEAVKAQLKNRDVPLGQILMSMGIVDRDVINTVMANKQGIPFVNLRQFRINPEIVRKLSAPVAYRYNIVPIGLQDGTLVIAAVNPMESSVLDELRFVTGMRMTPVLASEEDIRLSLETHYGQPEDTAPATRSGSAWKKPAKTRGVSSGRARTGEDGAKALASQLSSETIDVNLNEELLAESSSTLVKLVNKIILDAVEQKASDIHIESNPGRQDMRVRMRKDGTLVPYLDIPYRFRSAVISRIKIMSQLDITERRKPQDGKIDFSRYGPAQVELRVAIIPMKDGLEDVVMRVLAAASAVSMDQLGFDKKTLSNMKRLIAKPQGLFLVCGPTGSGKTTTLHSLLGHLNTGESKIWTAEDPVEITQPGLRQVQVNPKIGWTFAAAMRSFLRADPDIVMVGEMRDVETSQIGIEASLTGHLVFSTLHTNSAPECIVRLLDLGMDPFNFADALIGILAQRLTRRLCPACKVSYHAEASELDELLMDYCDESPFDPAVQRNLWRKDHGGAGGNITLWRASGCPQCDSSGYKGRMGLYELLVADSPIKRLVQGRALMVDVKAAAMASGMRTLKQDGIDKVLQGLTDIHQVRAVCG